MKSEWGIMQSWINPPRKSQVSLHRPVAFLRLCPQNELFATSDFFLLLHYQSRHTAPWPISASLILASQNTSHSPHFGPHTISITFLRLHSKNILAPSNSQVSSEFYCSLLLHMPKFTSHWKQNQQTKVFVVNFSTLSSSPKMNIWKNGKWNICEHGNEGAHYPD